MMADAVQKAMDRVASFRAGAAISGMIYLGDRLGLYRAMQAAGPVDAVTVGRACGVNARWVHEWLRGQAAAKLVDYLEDGRFELPDATAAVLAEEDSIASLVGMFDTVPVHAVLLDIAVATLASGSPPSPDWAAGVSGLAAERARLPWIREYLVPVIVPTLAGVEDRLLAGALVADVCCGSGVALLELAAAYPASEFHGFDQSATAVDRANTRIAGAGVDNATFHQGDAGSMVDRGPFDLVLTFDAMHELPSPEAFAIAVRTAVAEDGIWFIEDFRSGPAVDPDDGRGRLAAANLAGSLLVCLPRGFSGAALGSLGYTEDLARQVGIGAGFTRFRAHDFGHPIYCHFELRP